MATFGHGDADRTLSDVSPLFSTVLDRPGTLLAHDDRRIGFDCHGAYAHHIWHGDAKNRQYVTRDEILKTHHFDPDRHVEPDPDTGLLRWTDNAPTRLRYDVQTYFFGRREDG